MQALGHSSYLCAFPVLRRLCTPRTALSPQPKLSKGCGQFLMRPTRILSVWSRLASPWRSCWLTPLAPQALSLLLSSAEGREYLKRPGKAVGWLKRSPWGARAPEGCQMPWASAGHSQGRVGGGDDDVLCVPGAESGRVSHQPLQAGKLPVCCPCPHAWALTVLGTWPLPPFPCSFAFSS